MIFTRPSRTSGALAAAFLSAVLLVGAPLALAQQTTPAPAAPAPHHAKRPHLSAAQRVDHRIELLHKELMITPEQEDAWKAVADAMRDNAKTLDQLAEQRAKARDNMSAVEDLKSYEAIADAHADGLKKLVPAFAALYDKMSDAQKKNADAVFGHHPRHRAAKKG